MKLDIDATIDNLSGTPIETEAGTLTLKAVIINALLGSGPDEARNPLSGEEKVRRFKLASRIHGGDGEVTVEEAALIKQQVAVCYATIVVGRVAELIDGS